MMNKALKILIISIIVLGISFIFCFALQLYNELPLIMLLAASICVIIGLNITVGDGNKFIHEVPKKNNRGIKATTNNNNIKESKENQED